MTLPVPDVIQRIADSDDRRLAWTFFVFFSRFEYALKRTREFVNANAEPQWDAFGSQHGRDFHPEAGSELATAVAYFVENPPRKQRLDNNQFCTGPSLSNTPANRCSYGSSS